jgi:hypothetical protein
MSVGSLSIEMSSLAKSLWIHQLVPISQNFDLSYIASPAADEVSNTTEDVYGNCWLGAFSDHN